MEKIQKRLLSSPFMGRSDGVVFEGQSFDKPDDIIEYQEVQRIEKTGSGEHDFVIRRDIVVSNKVNRSDYINSFTSDVGIMNVLKKVLAGGESIQNVIDSGRFKTHQVGEVDLSNLPDNIVDAYKAVEKGVKKFDSLPSDLKRKQSMARFVESFSKDDFSKYIQEEVKKVISLTKKFEKKGDNLDE